MLWEFADVVLDMDKLIAMVDKRCVISALNDTIVNHEYSKELAGLFSAKMIAIRDGGHFIDEEGFSELPELLDELCKMLNKT